MFLALVVPEVLALEFAMCVCVCVCVCVSLNNFALVLSLCFSTFASSESPKTCRKFSKGVRCDTISIDTRHEKVYASEFPVLSEL